jgi:peptidoglycan/xylan/chitin deacetylase (PgdA/CDA1 family)
MVMYRTHAALVFAAAVIGCGGRDTRHSVAAAADSAAVRRYSEAGAVADSATAAPASSDTVKANHLGRIPVLEYHLIGDTESRWGRTRENFRKDLELVYERGYRPMTVAQMVAKDFSTVPAGKSPVVFTFDDASPGQFSYIERDGQLEIDPNSAIGIWIDFAKSHPDWKGTATFCVLNGGAAGHNFFGDKEKFAGQKNAWRFKKVKWLADNGFELCNHTLWHAQLSKYPDAVVQEQIARNSMGIDSAVAGYRVRTMALPQGLWPKNRSLAWSGSWTDPKTGKVVKYDFDAVLEVSGGPTRSPYDPQFNPKSINRVEVFGDELRRTLDGLDKHGKRFVK